jgi:hypothetical protein
VVVFLKVKINFGLMLAPFLVLPAGVASANPHTLPFTYPNETLPKGSFEAELYTDVNPLKVQADEKDPSQGTIWNPDYAMTIEAEYGLSDRWELGLYTVFEAPPLPGGDNQFMFDGLKWRVRTRFAEPGQLPVDVGLYFELETMHDEISLEEKLNLQRRFGFVTWMANLWVEQSLVRPFDSKAQGRSLHFIINPTTGFSFQATPSVHPGIEFWARGEPIPNADNALDKYNDGMHYFLGPALNLNFGQFWWSIAAYKHLNKLGAPNVGEEWGPLWFRTMIGVQI